MVYLPSPLPAFVINVEEDKERLAAVRAEFAPFEKFFILERSPGVVLPPLPGAAVNRLAGNPKAPLGRLGCFLAHVAAWERVAACGAGWGLVVEDDIRLSEPERLFEVNFPKDAEFVWVHDSMIPPGAAGELSLRPAWELAPWKIGYPPRLPGMGAYGYLLSSAGAQKLLSFFAKNGFIGHVDAALWRSVTPFEAATKALYSILDNTLLSEKELISYLKYPSKFWGFLTGYFISNPIVNLNKSANRDSRRKKEDKKNFYEPREQI